MEASVKEKDLVCGMMVEVNDSALHTDYQGKEYYFCSPGCQKAFEKNPEKYVEPALGGMAEGAGHHDCQCHSNHDDTHHHHKDHCCGGHHEEGQN